MENREICSTVINCFFDFQTLFSGVLAIIAALFTAWIIWRSANLPLIEDKKHNDNIEEKKRLYLGLVLSRDFRLLAARARMAIGTVRATVASNVEVTEETRKKTLLSINPIIDDWQFMSLLNRQTLNDIMSLHRKVSDHNFDIQRAGGVFGADNFRDHILNRMQAINTMAERLSTSILQETRE